MERRVERAESRRRVDWEESMEGRPGGSLAAVPERRMTAAPTRAKAAWRGKVPQLVAVALWAVRVALWAVRAVRVALWAVRVALAGTLEEAQGQAAMVGRALLVEAQA
jgi:hypothetical protein